MPPVDMRESTESASPSQVAVAAWVAVEASPMTTIVAKPNDHLLGFTMESSASFTLLLSNADLLCQERSVRSQAEAGFGLLNRWADSRRKASGGHGSSSGNEERSAGMGPGRALGGPCAGRPHLGMSIGTLT